MAKIEIWTDGSCCNKTHSKGGYGIVMVNGSVRQFCGGSYYNTSSPRMEIMGVLKALEKCEVGDEVTVYCDNEYVVNALEKGWLLKWQKNDFKDKKNVDLWRKFLKQYDRLRGKVTLKWVKGHNKEPMNELADALANMGANKKLQIKDLSFIPQ